MRVLPVTPGARNPTGRNGGPPTAPRRGSRTLVVEKASRWLRRELGNFDPPGERNDLCEARRTALAELALGCVVLRGLPSAAEYAWFTEPATCLLADAFRRKEVHSFLVEGPVGAFAGHLLMWAALPQEIAESVITRSELEALLEARNVTRVERTPTRQLELRYVLELAGLRHNLPSWREIYRRTLAATRPVTASLEPSDIYAITHTVFYVTGFGRNPDRALSRAERVRLIRMTDEIQERMIGAHHWDLVAELILARCCLAGGRTFADQAAWEALARAQAEEGHFLSAATLKALQGTCAGPQERREILFLAGYHTCLVVILAGALSGFDTDLRRAV